MFKDDYKNCFDSIKGDRQLLKTILEKADAEPVKVVRFKHVYRYAASVAAVFVLAGTVFLFNNGLLSYDEPATDKTDARLQSSYNTEDSKAPSDDTGIVAEENAETELNTENYNDSAETSENEASNNIIAKNNVPEAQNNSGNNIASADTGNNKNITPSVNQESAVLYNEAEEESYAADEETDMPRVSSSMAKSSSVETPDYLSGSSDSDRMGSSSGNGGGGGSSARASESSEAASDNAAGNAPMLASTYASFTNIVETDILPRIETGEKTNSSQGKNVLNIIKEGISASPQVSSYKENIINEKYTGEDNKFINIYYSENPLNVTIDNKLEPSLNIYKNGSSYFAYFESDCYYYIAAENISEDYMTEIVETLSNAF